MIFSGVTISTLTLLEDLEDRNSLIKLLVAPSDLGRIASK